MLDECAPSLTEINSERSGWLFGLPRALAASSPAELGRGLCVALPVPGADVFSNTSSGATTEHQHMSQLTHTAKQLTEGDGREIVQRGCVIHDHGKIRSKHEVEQRVDVRFLQGAKRQRQQKPLRLHVQQRHSYLCKVQRAQRTILGRHEIRDNVVE